MLVVSSLTQKTTVEPETTANQSNPPNHLRWKILLIGGSSGVGKTVASQEIAKRLAVSRLLVDDIRMALQATTTLATHPDLHLFLNYRKEQWLDPEQICRDWVRVGKALQEPLNAILSHHLVVPGVGRIILEGDGILPTTNAPAGDLYVTSVFIVEHNQERLLSNLRRRGRGFNEGSQAEQEAFAHASWLFGEWIVQEAGRYDIPVIDAHPQNTLVDRLMDILQDPGSTQI